MFARLFQNWFGSGLRPLERLVVDAALQRLAPAAQQRLRAQLAAVNRVQRIVADQEVDLYCWKDGRSAWDDALRFPGLPEETLLAAVTFTAPGLAEPCLVELWLVSGCLFSLEFNQSPRRIDPATVALTSVRVLLEDLAAKPADAATKPDAGPASQAGRPT